MKLYNRYSSTIIQRLKKEILSLSENEEIIKEVFHSSFLLICWKYIENEEQLIDDEERRKADALKNLKKADRGIKEYLYRASEDQKNSERIKVEI